MARVRHAHQQAKPVSPRDSVLNQPRAAHKAAKPYKVELVQITQHKKKLNAIQSYQSDAPQGFAFVPAENPDLVNWCKEQCRQRNMDVHAVSEKPKNKMYANPEKLSHHVHRVGYHFPIEIVKLACSKFGITFEELKKTQKDTLSTRGLWIAQGIEDYSSRQARQDGEEEALVQDAIRALFPKIPSHAAGAIIDHAFRKGTKRVGTAKDLPLARRVQLAVLAHIRHVYTPYDNLLKTGEYKQARAKVEPMILDKLLEWRDEKKEESDELEDTFREIIVLDDDEDESSDEDFQAAFYHHRSTSQAQQLERVHPYSYRNAQALRQVPGQLMLQSPQRQQLPVELYSATGRAGALERVPPVSPRAPLMRGADGRLYQLEPILEPNTSRQPLYESGPSAARPYARDDQLPPSPRVLSFDRPAPHLRHAAERDIVVPSVEDDVTKPTPTHRNATNIASRLDDIHITEGREQQHYYRSALPASQLTRQHYNSYDGKPGPSAYPYREELPRIEPEQQAIATTRSSERQPMIRRDYQRPALPGDVIDLTLSPPRVPVANREKVKHSYPVALPGVHGYSGFRSVRASPIGDTMMHYRERRASPRREYVDPYFEHRGPKIWR